MLKIFPINLLKSLHKKKIGLKLYNYNFSIFLNFVSFVNLTIKNDTKEIIEFSIDEDTKLKIEPYKIDGVTVKFKNNFSCFINDYINTYFYLLNPSTIYCYKGEGKLWNENLKKYYEKKNNKISGDYISVRALNNSIDCAISGLNGVYYKIDEMQHVNFARPEGDYILKFKDINNIFRQYKVRSGREYYVVNSESCIDTENNLVLPQFKGDDEIEKEAQSHKLLLKEREKMLKYDK